MAQAAYSTSTPMTESRSEYSGQADDAWQERSVDEPVHRKRRTDSCRLREGPSLLPKRSDYQSMIGSMNHTRGLLREGDMRVGAFDLGGGGGGTCQGQ